VEIPTIQVVFSVFVILVGTIITTEATPEFNLFGILLMFGAEISESTRLVVTQHLLVRCNFSVVEAQYFIAPLTG
jgi:drug/metabolite transporter (DMT)-like permease